MWTHWPVTLSCSNQDLVLQLYQMSLHRLLVRWYPVKNQSVADWAITLCSYTDFEKFSWVLDRSLEHWTCFACQPYCQCYYSAYESQTCLLSSRLDLYATGSRLKATVQHWPSLESPVNLKNWFGNYQKAASRSRISIASCSTCLLNSQESSKLMATILERMATKAVHPACRQRGYLFTTPSYRRLASTLRESVHDWCQ